MKSTDTRYGTFSKIVHWISALLVIVLLATGFRAGMTEDAAAKAAILQIHLPVAIAVLFLTVIRVVWWIFFDSKPAPLPDTPVWQESVGKWTHRLLYVGLFAMLGSGIALSIFSGAPDAIFGQAPLPNFEEFGPRLPHGLFARILAALVLLHAAAALFHHFVKKDSTLKRMWFGGLKE